MFFNVIYHGPTCGQATQFATQSDDNAKRGWTTWSTLLEVFRRSVWLRASLLRIDVVERVGDRTKG